jgi:hypothetical protein
MRRSIISQLNIGFGCHRKIGYKKSRVFCDIALQVGLKIWKSCYSDSDGPQYMGKLDKTKQLQLANRRLVAASELNKAITDK